MKSRSHPIRASTGNKVRDGGARAPRGALSLSAALLCSGVAYGALPSSNPVRSSEDTQWKALSIAPLARGGGTGLRQGATASVEPIAAAPERQQLDFDLTYPGNEPFGVMLIRAGANYADAAQAHAMVGKVTPGTKVKLQLGPTSGHSRSILQVELVAGIDRKLHISRTPAGLLSLRTERLAVDTTPVRVRGRSGGGLYWALRSAGASPQAAAEYLRTLSAHVDVGSEIGPNDMFDLVLAHRKAATGAASEGPLLFAGLNRVGSRPLQLVRWRSGRRLDWVDANALDSTPEAGEMSWPVAGRITSTFGYRVHPILRFRRLHRGIDFGSAWGSPIVAAATGQITAAGWAGGYGRQVRISHGGGIATTYSHMSSIVSQPGSFVRQGQLIGYVGSSGLSTGAHLHYEVYVSGQPVNPLSVRLSAPAPVDTAQANAIKARLKALLSVGTKGG